MATELCTDRNAVELFARNRDPLCLAERVRLEVIPSGETLHGRASVAAFFRGLSYERFADARFEVRAVGADERTGVGVIEWSFSGRQIRPAFGVNGLGAHLTLALALVCELGAAGITDLRLYFDGATARQQLTTQGGDPWKST